MAGDSAYVEESLRLEAVQTNNWVDEVILVEEPIEDLLKKIKPAAVIKGKELNIRKMRNAQHSNPMADALYSGLQKFLSGKHDDARDRVKRIDSFPPPAYARRHGLTKKSLSGVIEKFKDLKVCVVSDLIVDEHNLREYRNVQRGLTLVVTP